MSASPPSRHGRRVGSVLHEAIEALCPTELDGSDGTPTMEYLVVPNARRPRVLVPVSSPKVAGSSVRHCSEPQTRLSRLRRDAVLLALAVGAAPLVLRDRVWLPRGEGSIDAYVRDALGRDVLLSLYVGPVRANRKPVLQVLSPEGETLGFAKLGTRALTRDLIRAESATLVAMSRVQLNHMRVPRVLHTGQWRGHDVLVQSALPTWTARTTLTERDLAAAEREIATVHGTTRERLDTSAYWADLRDRLGALLHHEDGQALADAAGRLVERYPDLDLEYGAWHGDWTRWNMASTTRGLLVWDWERFTTGVPLGFDPIHHELHSRLQSGMPGPRAVEQAMHSAKKRLRSSSLEMAAESAEVTALLYLVDLGARYLHDRQADGGQGLDMIGSWLLTALLRRLGTA